MATCHQILLQPAAECGFHTVRRLDDTVMSENQDNEAKMPDPVEMSRAMASIAERSQRIVQAFLENQNGADGDRDALGMSGRQLGKRMGITAQSVAELERSEALGTIRLQTLRRAAEALDCTLVYALIPNTSLTGAVEARARKLAQRELSRVSQSMALEDQAVHDADTEQRIRTYIEQALRDRDLWDEP